MHSPPNHEGAPMSKILDDWRKDRKPEKPPEEPLEPGDSWEEPTGDGRSSRHQILGLQIEDSDKNLWFVPYGAILPSKLGPVSGGKFTFKIAGDECNHEITIEGPI